MKKIILIIIILFVTLYIVIPRQNTVSPVTDTVISATPTPVLISFIEDQDSRISYQIITATPSQISVYSNLKTATDSASAKIAHGCTSLVNAGFYTKEQTHLGQFISDSQKISGAIQSNLVDGYFSINKNAIISYEEPSDDVRISIQSGPVVWIDGKPRVLRLIQDEFARRMIVATQENGTVLFIALFLEDQTHSGPLLKRVPDILEKIAQKELISITAAVNLDGGSASAFLTPVISLSEFRPIGGYFCIK